MTEINFAWGCQSLKIGEKTSAFPSFNRNNITLKTYIHNSISQEQVPTLLIFLNLWLVDYQLTHFLRLFIFLLYILLLIYNFLLLKKYTHTYLNMPTKKKQHNRHKFTTLNNINYFRSHTFFALIRTLLRTVLWNTVIKKKLCHKLLFILFYR